MRSAHPGLCPDPRVFSLMNTPLRGGKLVEAAGVRPALVGLFACIRHRNGRDPISPDWINTRHPASKLHYWFAPIACLEWLVNGAYALLRARMSAIGTSVRLLSQTACKQEAQNGTAGEHFCALGLVPLVEISECTANCAERPHRLQIVITAPHAC